MEKEKSPKKYQPKKKAIAAIAIILVVVAALVISWQVNLFQLYSNTSGSGPRATPPSGYNPTTSPTQSPSQSPSPTSSDWTLNITGPTGASVTYSMNEVLSMPSTSGLGGYTKTSGAVQEFYSLGTYVGVSLQYLCNLVTGFNSSSTVTVSASDGYSYFFTYQQICDTAHASGLTFYNPTTGVTQTPTQPIAFVLAYSFSNSTYSGNLPTGQGNLRVMIVGPEGLVTWGTYSVYFVNSIKITDP